MGNYKEEQNIIRDVEAVVQKCSVKKMLLKISQNSGKHLCQSLFLIKLQAWLKNFIKKKTLAQVFSCDFCEISKNTFWH